MTPIERSDMEIRTVAESELEAAPCPECGSGNVLTAPPTCTNCANLRHLLRKAQRLTRIEIHRDPFRVGLRIYHYGIIIRFRGRFWAFGPSHRQDPPW